MNKDGIYYKVTQEYLHLRSEKRELMRERDNINAKLGTLEVILTGLDCILSEHGSHIYEHFVEKEPQENEGLYGSN